MEEVEDQKKKEGEFYALGEREVVAVARAAAGGGRGGEIGGEGAGGGTGGKVG